jgi:hypothetical protein
MKLEKKLASQGYIVQSLYVMKNLPVPRNCSLIKNYV